MGAEDVNPPGNSPLYEGLDSDWNDIVGAFPEDKRAELAPLLKERIDSVHKQYEPLKAYEDYQKSGVSSEQIATALNIYNVVENNPRQVYDVLAQHLGISPQEAKEVVEEVTEGDSSDPRVAKLQQQVETMAKVMLAEREASMKQAETEKQDAALEKEMTALRKKFGDIDEEEILMRMVHKNLSAEDAYKEYSAKVSELRRTRPAPMVMGNSGAIPRNAIDPTKLDNAGTKNLVAQMLQHAIEENRKA